MGGMLSMLHYSPTLDKENSKAIFISTPRGRNNYFAEFYYRGYSEEFPEWCSVKATYHENPRVSESDIIEAKKTMSANEFAKSIWQTLMFMKVRYGHLITKMYSRLISN